MRRNQTSRLLLMVVLLGMSLPVSSAQAGFWKVFALALVGDDVSVMAESDWEGPEPFIDQHDETFSGMCQRCHLTEETASAENLKPDTVRMCVQCHSVNRLPSHPITVTPSMSIVSDFPLNADGKMTCITCHNPHSGARNFLRGGDYEVDALEDFCQNCHFDWSTQSHEGTIGVVHQKQETPRISNDQIDYISKKCIGCHDGKNGPAAPISITGDGSFMWAGAGGGSHKIGRNFQEALSTSGRKLGLRENLSEDFSFYEGKMGCLSCHNLYSMNSYKTTITVNRSALCLACHDK